MSVKDRTRFDKLLAKWSPYFIISCTLLGAILGSFLVYYFQGTFPYEVLVAGLIAALFLTIIQVIKQKQKKDTVPETDERVVKNIFRFFAYTSHGFLSILFIALGVFTLLGNESISIFYLWILFFSYTWIVGIGALIIKRK